MLRCAARAFIKLYRSLQVSRPGPTRPSSGVTGTKARGSGTEKAIVLFLPAGILDRGIISRRPWPRATIKRQFLSKDSPYFPVPPPTTAVSALFPRSPKACHGSLVSVPSFFYHCWIHVEKRTVREEAEQKGGGGIERILVTNKKIVKNGRGSQSLHWCHIPRGAATT